MNAIMPLEERYEIALHNLGEKLTEAAQTRGDAERLEARLKQRKAILTLKHRKEAGSAAMAETMALADLEYERRSPNMKRRGSSICWPMPMPRKRGCHSRRGARLHPTSALK